MAIARALRSLLACALVAACEDSPGATVTLTDARISRDPAKNVVVEIDLLGHERLGGRVGTYCLRVTFVEEADVRDECKKDIEDGDTRTARFVGPNLAPGAVVKVRLRLNATDERRDLVAPER